MNKKVIIFDFDGTIADTLYLTIDIANSLSDKFGYEKVKKKDIHKLRNKKAQDILKEFKISLIKLPFIWRRIKMKINDEIEYQKPIKGIKEVLLELKKTGYKLGIITSNSRNNLNKFLKKNNLDIFNFVYSGSSIFGKTKVIKNLLKIQNLKPKETIYVGDDTRDIEAAKKANIQIISVSWGFNSKEILKKQKPDFLISKPKELIKILNTS